MPNAPTAPTAPKTPTNDVKEARAYIENFRRYTIPGADYVDTHLRRIQFDDMSDEDALFVAEELQALEIESAKRGGRTLQ